MHGNLRPEYEELAGLEGKIPPRLEHFLSGCSYQKALDFLENALSA